MDAFDELTILLVEPHILGRRLMRDVLKGVGVGTVLTVDRVEAAMKVFGQVHIDVIFCDWSESTDAPALLARLRGSDSPNRFVPIVMISAYNELDHVRRARDSGADEYLLKPFSPQMAVARLRSVLRHPRRYVEDGGFFGPDRRRHHLDSPVAERRQHCRYVERRIHGESWNGQDRRMPLVIEGGSPHVQDG